MSNVKCRFWYWDTKDTGTGTLYILVLGHYRYWDWDTIDTGAGTLEILVIGILVLGHCRYWYWDTIDTGTGILGHWILVLQKHLTTDLITAFLMQMKDNQQHSFGF